MPDDVQIVPGVAAWQVFSVPRKTIRYGAYTSSGLRYVLISIAATFGVGSLYY